MPPPIALHFVDCLLILWIARPQVHILHNIHGHDFLNYKLIENYSSTVSYCLKLPARLQMCIGCTGR